MVNKENLGVGCVEISPAAVKYVNQALKNRRLSYGPFIKRFEREFASAHDSQFAVMVNSGTSALRIAVAALKELGNWQDRDEVIVPALTFVATANVVLAQNLKPVFVDVDSFLSSARVVLALCAAQRSGSGLRSVPGICRARRVGSARLGID